MKAPLLPSRGDFFVFECKMSFFFLVGSCLFLLMVVQQFIVILRFL